MNFASHLENFGDQTALILADGSALSYLELAALADALYTRPNAPTDQRALLAVECENTLAAVTAYLGALRNNFPILMVDAGLSNELRERLYTHFNVHSVWSAAGVWRRRQCQSPEVHADLAVLLSTSGSMGAIKQVKLTLANLQANAVSIAHYLELDGNERPITTLPIHYSYGLSVLNSHLAVGATLLLTAEPVTTRSFWDYFRAHEATSLAGVPTLYTMLRTLRFERMALPSLRTMTQAGGALQSDQAAWFGALAQSRGQRFFVMYGQTEASARISYLPSERLLEKIGSIGLPIPGGRIELVAEDGSVIGKSGVAGELRYYGANVMMGYAENAGDLAIPDTQNGVLLTGDLAKRDDDGYFYLLGRLKRFIKVFGNRIGLDEVEQQLKSKGFNVAVTGRDDLLLIALNGSQSDLAALQADLPTWYRLHHSAIRIVPVASFPLSSSGKIQYADLLKQLAP